MKKNRAILLSGLLAACAVAVTMAAVVNSHVDPANSPRDASPPATEADLPPVIVVTPPTPTTIDLEAASPATSDPAATDAAQGDAELPVPEITWYDPYRLAEVGGIS